jgi:nucleoside-diphosphate-sugar epimerase
VRIAVTGGAGFLGSATVRALQDHGHHAWAFDHAHGDDILGPLDKGLSDPCGDEGELGRPADHVVHLAGVLGTAELFDDVTNAIDVNVHGTRRILDWCRKNGAGFTGITMPDAFPSIYTATKIAADRLAAAYHHAYGMPVSRVRAFNAHGPGQKHGPGHPQKILPTFATLAWAGKPLPVWGDGTQGVDLVTTRDVARMLVSAVQYGGRDEVFDAGTGTMVSVLDVADFVNAHTGNKAGVELLPMRKGEVPTNIVAKGEGWDLAGWRPAFRWTDVADTIDSYRPRLGR